MLTGDATNADPVCDKSAHHQQLHDDVARIGRLSGTKEFEDKPLVFRNMRNSKEIPERRCYSLNRICGVRVKIPCKKQAPLASLTCIVYSDPTNPPGADLDVRRTPCVPGKAHSKYPRDRFQFCPLFLSTSAQATSRAWRFSFISCTRKILIPAKTPIAVVAQVAPTSSLYSVMSQIEPMKRFLLAPSKTL